VSSERDTLVDAVFDESPRAAAVVRLGAAVNADVLLDLHGSDLRAPPEGFDWLAYLPHPGLCTLHLYYNLELTALPMGLWSLTGLEPPLEELNLSWSGLRALP
jgi:hypothetical protein